MAIGTYPLTREEVEGLRAKALVFEKILNKSAAETSPIAFVLVQAARSHENYKHHKEWLRKSGEYLSSEIEAMEVPIKWFSYLESLDCFDYPLENIKRHTVWPREE